MSSRAVWVITLDHCPVSMQTCQQWRTILPMMITALPGNIADMIRAMKLIKVYGKLKAEDRYKICYSTGSLIRGIISI